jgi:hypothetical protein
MTPLGPARPVHMVRHIDQALALVARVHERADAVVVQGLHADGGRDHVLGPVQQVGPTDVVGAQRLGEEALELAMQQHGGAMRRRELPGELALGGEGKGSILARRSWRTIRVNVHGVPLVHDMFNLVPKRF